MICMESETGWCDEEEATCLKEGGECHWKKKWDSKEEKEEGGD